MGPLLILGFMLLLLLGLPIAYVLGIIPTIWAFLQGVDLTIAPSRIQSGINSFTLMAIPFFIMAAEVMNKVGITERLINFVNMIFGRFRGGLAQVCIYAEILFSGITGSAIADIAALGTVFVPAMAKQGYKKAFAAANIANAVVVGPIIPPSITLVIYGAVTGVSIGGLLLGAFIPGIIFAVGQSLFVASMAKRRNFPKIPVTYTKKEYIKGSVEAIPAILMPLIILGGIFGGIVTPTESAAVAVAYALLLGLFLYRSIKPKDLVDVGVATMKESAVLFFIIGVSGILGWMLARMGVAVAVANLMIGLTDNANILFAIVIGVLLFMGTWLDSTAIIILVSPIVAPLMASVGVDPIHFGVVFIVAVSIGIITPPLGVCLFAASSISKIRIEDIIKEIWPFIIYDICMTFFLAYVPILTTWLPSMAHMLE